MGSLVDQSLSPFRGFTGLHFGFRLSVSEPRLACETMNRIGGLLGCPRFC